MDFEWTDEERAARDRIAGVLDAGRLARIEALEDEEIRPPRDELPDAHGGRIRPGGALRGTAVLREELLDTQRALAAAGYFDVAGGPANPGRMTARIAMDLELARASASFFLAIRSTRSLVDLVEGWGSAALRADLLDALRAGERIGAVALPDSGGAAEGAPTAEAGEGGAWMLAGRRAYLANGPIADRIAVFATVRDAAPVAASAAARSVIAFVHPDRHGVNVGERLRLLGLGGLATCAIDLDGVRVPAECVAGPFGDDAAAAWCRLTGDLALATASVGLMHRAFEAAKEHAQRHHRGGKPIVARQEIGFRLAEMLATTQAAEWLCRRAAWMAGACDADAATVVGCARVFCAERAERVASGAMQVMAGRGCVTGNAAERAYRDAKTMAAMGTTVEVARMRIADALLARV